MSMNIQQASSIREEAEEMVEWLASFGRTENNGVTRLLYSPAWLSAQRALERKMNEIGLRAYFDDVGNLFGRLEGTEQHGPVILTGSHVDTVVNGGKYDGAYGIISGLMAVKHLRQRYGAPQKTIEVVSLCEEEGSRFPFTFWGSGSITGKYTYEDIRIVRDSDGILFTEAMNQAGFGKGDYRSPRRDDLECFVELHVEQGAILEREGQSIGIVSHIVGQRRYTIQVMGESNHAGTTPMSFRKDAMSAASELISYITKKAKQTDPVLVATVGKISVKPNVPNVIAGEVTFTLDVRHHEETLLDEYCSELLRYFQVIAADHYVEVSISQWMNIQPVGMDETLTEISNKIACSKGVSFRNLVSGAGHDAQVFGTFCPTSLLFVPSHRGISHSPKEYTSSRDLESGINMLIELLYQLAY